MKPKPFRPQACDDDRFVRDSETGKHWQRIRSPERVLYADTDRSGVVYHANYLRYFELGRASLMRELTFPYKQVEESGYVYPIVELGMNFFHPLRYDDSMWVHTRPLEMERVRVTFEYVITEAETGHLVCVGFTRHCALNTEGTPVAVDPHTASMVEEFPK